MELKDIIAAIQSVGFPVVMVLWFMLRTEKVIAANTEALTTLALTESQEREALRQLLDKSGVKS